MGTFSCEAKLQTLDYYVLTLNGLTEGEEIKFTSNFGNASMENNFIYSSSGMGYSPGITGKKGGEALLKFTRKSGDELTLILYWGYEVVRPLLTGCELNFKESTSFF